jgi:hypothetical protein
MQGAESGGREQKCGDMCSFCIKNIAMCNIVSLFFVTLNGLLGLMRPPVTI